MVQEPAQHLMALYLERRGWLGGIIKAQWNYVFQLSVAETPSWLKCGPCFEFDGVSHEKISTSRRHATGTAARRVRTPSRGEAGHRLTVPQAA
jgi:hypothetical protein